MTTVSVIIVNYNSGYVLHEAINRLLLSTIPLEIFISDNGSTDQSLIQIELLLSSNPNIHIIKNGVNLGFSAGNNLILPLISTEYILFLNPDCLIESNSIERLIDNFNQDPNIGMIGCLIKNSDGTEQSGCRRLIPTPWSALIRIMKFHRLLPNFKLFQDFNLTGNPLPNHPVDVEAISGAFMLVKQSAIKLVGPLDPGYFLHCEDLDWCLRFTQSGFRIVFVPDVVITHFKGSCSISRPIFVEWHKHKGMVRFYRKHFSHKYPAILLWFVIIGIWIRFGFLSIHYSFKHFSRLLGVNYG